MSTVVPSTEIAEFPKDESKEDLPTQQLAATPAANVASKKFKGRSQSNEDAWWNWNQGSQGQNGARGSGCNAAWKNNDTWKNGAWWQQQEQQQVEEEQSWQGEEKKRTVTRGGGRRAGCTRPQQKQEKWQCQFTIGIEEESHFHVVRRIIGIHGAHVKAIAAQSGSRLRLRGRGSKFLEGPEQQESTDPLMLCMSAPDHTAYDMAVQLIIELIERVYGEYTTFCEKNKLPAPELRIQLHEGRREGGY